MSEFSGMDALQEQNGIIEFEYTSHEFVHFQANALY